MDVCTISRRGEHRLKTIVDQPAVGRPAVSAVGLAIALVVASAITSSAVTIDWVGVGNAGNSADPATGYGAVNHPYSIGKYEVTIGQYADFLNAAAKTDPYGLWTASMGSDPNIAGITRSGTSGGFTYSLTGPAGDAAGQSQANRPIAFVSWWDAARFSNWMQNGQGSGGTETGAYTLNGKTSGSAPTRNADATVFIPTENEWFKAAYYSPQKNAGLGGYYTYATQSDSAPGNTIGSTANQANYHPGTHYSTTPASEIYSLNQNYLTDGGAFSASGSFYGTFDQDGNVQEWSDDFWSGLNRGVGVRGGFWNSSSDSSLSKSSRTFANPSDENSGYGFRLGSVVSVPEPTSLAILLTGIAGSLVSAIRARCSLRARGG